jgi:predicted nucleic acid-binding protein
VIYLDSSVALAYLFGEGRLPPRHFWEETLVSSGLLEYEVWNRVNARGFGGTLKGSTSALIRKLRLLELTPSVLARALEPFPVPVRTLDALHLATIEFIRREGEAVELASYDNRLLVAAQALGVTLAAL